MANRKWQIANEPMASIFKIKQEFLPTRCEICHQADLLNPETGFCQRCEEVKSLVVSGGQTETGEANPVHLLRRWNRRNDFIPIVPGPWFQVQVMTFYALSAIPLLALAWSDHLHFVNSLKFLLLPVLLANIGLLVAGNRLKEVDSGGHQTAVESLVVMHGVTAVMLFLVNIVLWTERF